MSIGRPGASYRGYAGLAMESEYGAGAPPEVFMDVVSDGFSTENNIQHESTIRGRGRAKSVGGAFNDEGEVELIVAPENGFGLLLAGVMGEETVTTQDPNTSGTAVVGEHEFVGADYLPSLSVELGLGEISPVRHVGTAVDTIEISHEAEEYLTASADLPAAYPDTSVAAAAPTYTNTRSFAYFDGTFNLDGLDRTVDVAELSVSVENNTEKLYRDQRGVSKMSVGERAVSIEATLDFENMDLWERMFGGTGATEPEQQLWTGSLDGTWTSPETIADTNVGYSFGFDAPAVQLSEHESTLNERDLIQEEVTFELLYDESASQDIAFTLINGRTDPYIPAGV